MSSGPWNHNIHYHDVVLRSVPHRAARALDVGCGQGLLARRLAGYCDEVIGIDVDHHAILGARAAPVEEGRLTFVEGDVMTHPFSAGSFDLIAAVATLHHLPLRPALTRFRNLLKPGGVLTIIGLYRGDTLADLAFTAVAFPASWMLRWLRGHADVGAPLQDPRETLREIRNACDSLLPDAVVSRHLLFRYSMIWHKPYHV